MSQQEIHLPPDLYNLLRRAADESNRSVDDVLQDHIRTIYQDPEVLLADDQLDDFSNDDLWMLVYRRAEWRERIRARELTTKGKEETLSEDEQKELESLLSILDKHMLLRSKALALLNQRGFETAHLFR